MREERQVGGIARAGGRRVIQVRAEAVPVGPADRVAGLGRERRIRRRG
ncbi:hypothetical protein [Plantactinospora sp. B5E13]